MEAYRRAAHPDELLAGALPPSHSQNQFNKTNNNMQQLAAPNC